MGWYDAFKDAISLAQKADNIELVKTIMELQQQMSDMQQENRDLRDSNRDLKDEIRQLRAADDIESKLTRHKGAYYTLKHSNAIDEDFCAACWSEHKIIIPLNRLYNGAFSCPKCKNVGHFDNYRDYYEE